VRNHPIIFNLVTPTEYTLRASPATSHKGIWSAPDTILLPATRPKGSFRLAKSNTVYAPRAHPRSTGDASGAPDRARSEAGSGGTNASLTQERCPTVAYHAIEVIGVQRWCSFHRGATASCLPAISSGHSTTGHQSSIAGSSWHDLVHLDSTDLKYTGTSIPAWLCRYSGFPKPVDL
jgi:hypothetical protein